ncbi:hypothetical protein SKAU_G00298500 [Synaphobranchus kaupii]|uniref:Uncharacterized protein n=1 Tax=Synaphobranchus kaupii TaxID=118154 RepID=A0A9Q1IM26_SYNKA|nr:hypothetical protein SKAU_G00298500 [Synaphobranchus kaupii]
MNRSVPNLSGKIVRSDARVGCGPQRRGASEDWQCLFSRSFVAMPKTLAPRRNAILQRSLGIKGASTRVTCHQEFTDAPVRHRVPIARASESLGPAHSPRRRSCDGRLAFFCCWSHVIKQVSVCSVGFPDVCGTDRASHAVY